ncbi:MAG TPA: branched-chain amino acid ABC transporter permease [Paracoccus solventivorans]|uniref:Branched-chain amino acid ABC transporter permease n=1 Tax=Paracoccus solventivorans TaxID=53463 RepID=A0A832PL35_9RHOB|nr:branched-chain amino acid ABC transporter permease [Paracoccus solventivorans]HHW32906.1 branched-chain amino acid ABC transporter permease [Paracoccus solventivorans]
MFANPMILFIQVMNSLSLAMNLFIIAAGLTLIFGVLRIVNFAHGAFYMVGAYIALSILRVTGDTNLGFLLGVLGAGALMGAMACVVERGLLSRLYDKEHMLQLLFTFALVLVIKDLVKMIWGSGQYSIGAPPFLRGAVNLGISHYPKYALFLCVMGPIIAVAIWFFMERTRWGRILRAAREDRVMLNALGTDVKLVYSGVFVTGAALAAMGGALAAPRSAVDPGMDSLVIIDAFIIVIIGGLGSLLGSFVGALILGFLTVMGSIYLKEWVIVASYVMMVVILLVRPWGLFGKADEERH